MKNPRCFLFGSILALALSLSHATPAQTSPTNTSSRHCLWEVAGASNTVYLLGSIHLLKPDNYPLAAPLEAAFSNSPIAVFETDIDKMEQPETQQKLLSKALLPPGQTLSGELSPEIFASFSNHVVAAGFPMSMFERFKPSMAAITLAMLEMRKLGLDPRYGVDQHFFRLARKDGKQIVPLETVDFQISLVTDFSKSEDDELMKSTLEDIDNTRSLLAEMVDAWQTGDAAGMERMLNTARTEAPEIFKRLVTDRNRRWVPRIEEMLHGGTNAVVIVGAGHLVGADGVVELLKKDGFRVTQE